MATGKIKPGNIAEYIDAAPEATQKKLLEMYDCIRAAAPGATENIKWNMPSFSYERILVTFAGFKHHIGFFPTPSAITAFQKQLSKYTHASGSVRFPLNKPLPLALIRKMTLFRVKESVEKDKKWRSPEKDKK